MEITTKILAGQGRQEENCAPRPDALPRHVRVKIADALCRMNAPLSEDGCRLRWRSFWLEYEKEMQAPLPIAEADYQLAWDKWHKLQEENLGLAANNGVADKLRDLLATTGLSAKKDLSALSEAAKHRRPSWIERKQDSNKKESERILKNLFRDHLLLDTTTTRQFLHAIDFFFAAHARYIRDAAQSVEPDSVPSAWSSYQRCCQQVNDIFFAAGIDYCLMRWQPEQSHSEVRIVEVTFPEALLEQQRACTQSIVYSSHFDDRYKEWDDDYWGDDYEEGDWDDEDEYEEDEDEADEDETKENETKEENTATKAAESKAEKSKREALEQLEAPKKKKLEEEKKAKQERKKLIETLLGIDDTQDRPKAQKPDADLYIQGNKSEDVETCLKLLSISMQDGKETAFDQLLANLAAEQPSLSDAIEQEHDKYKADLRILEKTQAALNMARITGRPATAPRQKQSMKRALCALLCRQNALDLLQPNIARIKAHWT